MNLVPKVPLRFKGEVLSLVTIEGVKSWMSKGTPYRCVYEPVEFTGDGKPRYRCIYLKGESAKPFVLVTTRVGEQGAEVRLFNIWPGLFKHHHEFGDGRKLCFDREFSLGD